MQSFGLIVVGPIWGLISAQLFFQTGEECIKAGMYLIGLFKHKVSAKKLFVRMIKALFLALLCALILVFGFWVICVRYPDLRTPSQNVLYLAFALLATIYIVSQMPYKLRNAWRHATVPGAIEDDAVLDAEDEAERKEIDQRGPGVYKSNKNEKDVSDVAESGKNDFESSP